MVKDKVKFTLWLSPEMRREVELAYREDNCASQSEFIEKSIKFYSGYLHTQKASEYHPRVISEVLEGKFAVNKKKLGRIMLKHSVETNNRHHIL